jgi:hypothetical protein
MANVAVDIQEFDKALMTLITADANVTALIGNPPRIYDRPPRSLTFPWVRKDSIPAAPLLGTMKGAAIGIKWLRRVTYQFSAFALENTLATVCDIQKRLADVLDFVPANITFANAKVALSLPGLAFADYDEFGTAMSVVEYTFTLEDTV